LRTATPYVTGNENKGGARFDRDFTSRFFVFGGNGWAGKPILATPMSRTRRPARNSYELVFTSGLNPAFRH